MSSWLSQNVNNNIVCANTVTLGLARDGATRTSPVNIRGAGGRPVSVMGVEFPRSDEFLSDEISEWFDIEDSAIPGTYNANITFATGNKPQLRYEVLSNGLTIVYLRGTVIHDPAAGTGRFGAGDVLWQLPPEYTPTSKLFFITYGTPQAAPGESGGLTIEGTDGAAADVGKFTKQMVGPDCGLESCFYFIEEA